MKSRNPNQMDLLTWVPPKTTVEYSDDVAGKGELRNRISRVIGRALRDAKDEKSISRERICELMREQLGRGVSTDQLNKWASEAADSHRIPLDAFLAIARITGANELIGFVASEFGMMVVSSEFQGIIDLHLITEHEAQIAEQKRILQADLRRKGL